MKINNNTDQVVKDRVIAILTGPDDDEGYDADPVESKRLTNALIDLISDVNEGDAGVDEIAEFIFDTMKWNL